jgi:superfamily II DNA/RNA helicase
MIVFCERKIDVDEFQNYFNFNNVRAAGLHGDKEQGQRQVYLF